MDTSETYIKMCDHPKIQGQWEPQDGDWYHRPVGRVFSGINLVKDASFKRHYFNWKNHPEHEVCAKVYKEHTWLPRQDQIQGMFEVEGYIALLRELEYWLNNEESREIHQGKEIPTGDKDGSVYLTGGCDTFEQLWLAYYMDEEHNLIWDGDEWKDNG